MGVVRRHFRELDVAVREIDDPKLKRHSRQVDLRADRGLVFQDDDQRAVVVLACGDRDLKARGGAARLDYCARLGGSLRHGEVGIVDVAEGAAYGIEGFGVKSCGPPSAREAVGEKIWM